MRKQIDNYSIQSELGSGVYSRVFKAVHMLTKQEVAIKMVKADKFKDMPKLEQGTINQINTLTSLKPCPNIIQYLDMLKTINNFYFVYEYCNGGTLERTLKANKLFGETKSLLYFKQLMNGFRVLAENHIMHRDIKPDNILIHNDILKIADFGFCKPLEHQDGMAQTMLGSPIYMAPEVLKGEQYTMKADVWSLGVVLYRMVFGFCPFQSNNIGKLILLLNQQQLKIPSQPSISATLEELLRKMLTKDPKKRADWNEVLNYQITEAGEIYDVRIKNQKYDSPKASTIASVSSAKSPYIKEEPNQTIRNSKKIESPYHYDNIHNDKYSKKDKAFYKPTESIPHQNSIRQNYSCKSTYKGCTYSKKQTYLKSHRKCTELTSIIMDIMLYESGDAVAIAYYLCKNVEKQLIGIHQSLRKEGFSNTVNYSTTRNDDSLLNQLSSIVSEQLKNLNQLIFGFEGYLNEMGIKSHEACENKKKYLKNFIAQQNNSSKQELSLCHQLLDYVLEEILINKKTYQKLNFEQLHKKIKQKLHYIN